MSRINLPLAAALIIGLVAILAAFWMLSLRNSIAGTGFAKERSASASQPQKRCASQVTYDRIKGELFREAAQVRRSDHSAFDKIAAYASVRMERPLLRSHDEDLGTLRCTGRLSLDLPPSVRVIGGRQTLSADVDYILQPAADGSGDVVMLEGTDPIVIPLATLASSGQAKPPADVIQPGQPEPSLAGSTAEAIPSPPAGSIARPPATAEPPARQAVARPSFNCRYARTRGELSVCSNENLAALDRQMAAQYYRALAGADARQRQLLRSTRDKFLGHRDRCPSDGCIAETYQGRMREIRDIMRGTWRPAA